MLQQAWSTSRALSPFGFADSASECARRPNVLAGGTVRQQPANYVSKRAGLKSRDTTRTSGFRRLRLLAIRLLCKRTGEKRALLVG